MNYLSIVWGLILLVALAFVVFVDGFVRLTYRFKFQRSPIIVNGMLIRFL